MMSHRTTWSPLLVAALLLAGGCGIQPTRITATHPDATPSVATQPEGLAGPILCFQNASLDFCYPTPGYCPCPATEVPYAIAPGQAVTMNWHADPQPGTEIFWYRWALDIADVEDETPRVNEATDLAHWSVRSLAATSATLGPWNDGETHRLYVDVDDTQGLRSLGIVRFDVSAGANQPPDCSGAVAAASTWPPNGSLVPVTITGVTDPDGDAVTITVTGITQDEPVLGGGDDTCPDAVIENGAARVRRERSGAGNGRVYTIAFTATDPHGGSCEGSVDVCVPHDRGRERACVKDALSVSSLACVGEAEQQASR